MGSTLARRRCQRRRARRRASSPRSESPCHRCRRGRGSHRSRWRDHLGARRSAVTAHRRILDDLVLRECDARARIDRHTRDRADGARATWRSAARPGPLLSRAPRRRIETLASRALPCQVTFGRRRHAGRPVRVVWTADVCGQGWGIDPSRGGMQLFKRMADASPDLFLHVGDTIYADGPLRAEVTLDDGTVWRNIVTPAKSKVAETLDEYRGNHLYNRLDEHYRQVSIGGRADRDVGRSRSPRQLVSPAGAARDRAVPPKSAWPCSPRGRGRRSSSSIR